jgi:nucleotide-binding universal stress UspA family protein
MSYKDILVIADDAKSAPVRLDVAAALTATHGAHLVALHVHERPYLPAELGQGFPAAMVDWQESVMHEHAKNAKNAVDAAQRRNGCAYEWREIDGEAVSTTVLHSRYADLVVSSQGRAEDEGYDDYITEELIMGSGRPTLVVPSYGKFPTVGERVLVAWNRTREAARAVHDALPILRKAKAVRIMEINPDRGDTHVAGADIALHLARHGVKAEAGSTSAEDIKAGDVLLSRAADLGADLIVMGAYGHSRLREYTFSGMTLHLLRHMTVPVLMSH